MDTHPGIRTAEAPVSSAREAALEFQPIGVGPATILLIAAWIGLMAVTQNIVGSLFNSHLTDFTQTWIYVFAVGVFGGGVLRDRGTAKPADPGR